MKMRELCKDEEPLDVCTPSISDISKKFNVDAKYLLNQLKKGIAVEYEHTSDKKIATEIALDHLNEFPDYYERLAKAEGK